MNDAESKFNVVLHRTGAPKMNNETKPDAPAKGFAEIRRDQVFAAVDSERIYQELKWGKLEEHPQSVGAYLTLMRVHLADAEAAWARSSGDAMALDRLRRVLAIGVACGEQHGMLGRKFTPPSPQSDDWESHAESCHLSAPIVPLY
jgi:hypothetical protein